MNSTLIQTLLESTETTLRYQDAFITMNPIFIAVCYMQFIVFTFLSARVTCKYLPILTTSMVSILLITMFCYLVQAALFSRVRKKIGAEIITDENDLDYDQYLRMVSCVQWTIYLSFFVIIFIIQYIYQEYLGCSEKTLQRTINLMKVFIVFYLLIMMIFHSLAYFLPETNVERNDTMYFIGGLTLIIYQIMFISFVRRIRVLWEIVDDYYFYLNEGQKRNTTL